eukprot:gene2172-3088_t
MFTRALVGVMLQTANGQDCACATGNCCPCPSPFCVTNPTGRQSGGDPNAWLEPLNAARGSLSDSAPGSSWVEYLCDGCDAARRAELSIFNAPNLPPSFPYEPLLWDPGLADFARSPTLNTPGGLTIQSLQLA